MAMKRLRGDDVNELPIREAKRNLSFSRAVREVLRQHSAQEFLVGFEPFLRRVVREEVERTLYTSSATRFRFKYSETCRSRRWELHIRSRLPSTLFTSSRIEAEDGVPVQVVIVDASSKKTITSGPLSSLKVEVLVLNGDFGKDEEEDWTQQEFEANVTREREGKRPLLAGELVIALKDGVGKLSEISFTDNSSWIKSRTFRLGVKVIESSCPEERIREARSEAFIVKDHRGESYKKHYPPSLDDDIWRLEKIGKDGVYHKKLSDGGIKTVQDFLRFLVTDSVGLRSNFCSGMSSKSWEATVQHAKTCLLDNKIYQYEKSGVQVLLNSIYEVVGVAFDGHVCQMLNELSAAQMILVEYVKQRAYKNQMDIVSVDTLSIGSPSMSFLALNYASISGSSVDLQDQDGLTPKENLGHLMNLPYNGLSDISPQVNDVLSDLPPLQTWTLVQGNSFNSRTLSDGPQDNIGINWPQFSDDRSQFQTLNWNKLFQSSADNTGSSYISSAPGYGICVPRKPSRGWFKLKTALKWGIYLRKDLAYRRMARSFQLSY
ncbi:calmodulin-binding protein 60 B-like isoform X2 [Aristolochia californica]|uniref:calmodulin-binding protein 60 B-like isoform X2 n=1 Tax=Aristolochia californica TaxID=171875 RepID=UPI0035D5A333